MPTVTDAIFPTTRYQGSKRRLLDWLWSHIGALPFTTVLDVFGGTGAVSHRCKVAGKAVTYNDQFAFNAEIGRALIANDDTHLTAADLDRIVTPRPDVAYPDFIARTFGGIYFTDDENAWLDRAVYHIDHLLTDPRKQSLARFALFQACLSKRPFNLFHRANLSMRTRDVKRSFGNKRTWDRPFAPLLRQFAAEANRAVCANGHVNRVICGDALTAPTGFDLVYIDPPYINARGVGVDYLAFYHFLEGLTGYDRWPDRIDWHSKHRRFAPQPSPWANPGENVGALDALFARHRDSLLVVSYRDDGLPSRADLVDLLRAHKTSVRVVATPQQYALSRRQSHELLLIGV